MITRLRLPVLLLVIPIVVCACAGNVRQPVPASQAAPSTAPQAVIPQEAPGPLRTVAVLPGVYAQAVHLAILQLAARNLDATKYEVTIVEDKFETAVLFQEPGRGPHVLGGGFEVVIDKKTGRVTNAHYGR
jgi:hypothetical protein